MLLVSVISLIIAIWAFLRTLKDPKEDIKEEIDKRIQKDKIINQDGEIIYRVKDE